MTEDLANKLNTLETRLDDLEKRTLADTQLRELGLKSGSKGVFGVLLLLAGVAIIESVLVVVWGKSILTSGYLWLCVIAAVALLGYFGFIYRFTLKGEFDAKKGRGSFETKGRSAA